MLESKGHFSNSKMTRQKWNGILKSNYVLKVDTNLFNVFNFIQIYSMQDKTRQDIINQCKTRPFMRYSIRAQQHQSISPINWIKWMPYWYLPQQPQHSFRWFCCCCCFLHSSMLLFQTSKLCLNFCIQCSPILNWKLVFVCNWICSICLSHIICSLWMSQWIINQHFKYLT